jgi:hypothetical protein
VIDEDLVLLDVAADRYLCASGGAALLRNGGGGRLKPASKAAAQILLQAGLAAVGDRAPATASVPSRPSVGLQPGSVALRCSDAVRLAACVLDLARHYRGRSFSQILAYVRAARAVRPLRRDPEAAAAAAARFEAAVLWLPVSRKCLVRSFLLMRFLHRCGLDADWVIAVRTWPFAAHCWVQLGELCLEEPPERLAAFHPICVV